MDASSITAIVSVAGLVLTVLLLVGGGLFWLWKLNSRVDHLEHRIDHLAGQMQEIREDLREEIRRGNQQLLQALVNHSHDVNGHPIFRAPVGME